MVFDWFKSKEDKERELLKKQEEARERQKAESAVAEWERERTNKEKEYEEIINQIIFTPECKSEYESRVGYPVEVIDTGDRDKGVLFEKNGSTYKFNGDADLKRKLAEAGIEAVVETSISFRSKVSGGGYQHTHVNTEIDKLYYGLPVTRKKGGPYR